MLIRSCSSGRDVSTTNFWYRGVNPGGGSSTSKGGVIALSQALASAYAADHIRVNCIVPGMVYTPMVAEILTDELREQRRFSTPLQTEGEGWDIGWAAVFLNSDEARWITGIVLPVDGGALLTRRSW